MTDEQIEIVARAIVSAQGYDPDEKVTGSDRVHRTLAVTMSRWKFYRVEAISHIAAFSAMMRFKIDEVCITGFTMAKTPSTDLSVKDEKTSALALPDFMRGDQNTGVQGIDQEDVALPRISLLQALSPQVSDGSGRPGEYFHRLSEDNRSWIIGDRPIRRILNLFLPRLRC